VALPSGLFGATATSGSIELLASASIDLSGRTVPVTPEASITTPGGQAAFVARQGNITSMAGSSIAVQGAGQEASGSVAFTAGGTATIEGTLRAFNAASSVPIDPAKAGRLSVEAASVTNPTALLSAASDGGFNRELSLRQTQGNLNLATAPGSTAASVVLRAQRLEFTADTGTLSLNGISLAGVSADRAVPGVPAPSGSIMLNAGQAVAMGSGVSLSGGQAAGDGVEVLINAVGGLTMAGSANAPVTVDLRGSNGARDGSLEIRVPRGLAPSQIALANANVIGGRTTVTSVDQFSNITEVRNTGASSGSILSLRATNGALPRASAFMNSTAGPGGHTASSILAAIAPLTTNAIARPEIEIVGAELGTAPGSTLGDIVVSQNLDFSAERFNGRAGVLTIRAPRNLIISGTAPVGIVGPEAVINDGFIAGGAVTRSTASNSPFNATGTESWSYRLIAGANPNASSPLQTREGDTRLESAGDLRLLNNRQIRTGTGDITLRAAGDIALGVASANSNDLAASGAASVLTYGRTDTSTVGPFVLPTTAGLPSTQQVNLQPRYTLDGGDIALSAGRSITSIESGNLVSSWLFRWGQTNPASDSFVTNRQVSWWARPDLFRQSVGALGGGNITIQAGQDVAGVSASIASTGRLTGVRPSDGVVVETGGGHLEVSAGNPLSAGSILSGSFNVMRGAADIRTTDSIGSNRLISGLDIFPTVGMGDARVQFTSRTEAVINQVYNPTLAPGRTGPVNANVNNFAQISQISTFSTYSDRSSVGVLSIGGSVGVTNSSPSDLFLVAGLLDPNSLYQGRDLPFQAYPGRVTVRSASSDVTFDNARLVNTAGAEFSPSQVFTMPSSQGQFEALAARDIRGRGVVYEGDFDVQQGFGVRSPARSLVGLFDWANAFNPTNSIRASTPTRLGDGQPNVLAAGRDIVSTSAPADLLELNFASATRISAGRDVRNLAVTAQNIGTQDLTSVTAARDVNNDVAYSPLNRLSTTFAGITLNGPGELVIRSGRDIALGTSQGIVTRGNATNPALSAQGASITLVAGLAEDADYAGLLRAYVDPTQTISRPVSYDQKLVDFVRAELGVASSPNLSPLQAWASLQTLPVHRQHAFARNIFFAELRAGGVGFGSPSSADFQTAQRAYNAAAVLFPRDGVGNIDVIFSQVKTEQGGSIEVINPGTVCRTAPSSCIPATFNASVGNVVAGLTSPPPELTVLKKPAELGFLTLNGGDMNFFTGRDIAINQSRALTAGGGSITMFSALGNIDAGRGSRSAISAPPPQVRVDANGNIVVELPGAVQGSGIGVLVTRSDVPVGDVFLFAPKGFLDAGEAGVRSSGNVVVAATEVRNAANISFGGSGVGVPVSTPSVNIGGLSSSTTAASSGQAASAAAQSSTSAGARSQRRTLLVLEFLGFGEDGEEAYRRRRGR
jgi:hypothetical protein